MDDVFTWWRRGADVAVLPRSSARLETLEKRRPAPAACRAPLLRDAVGGGGVVDVSATPSDSTDLSDGAVAGAGAPNGDSEPSPKRNRCTCCSSPYWLYGVRHGFNEQKSNFFIFTQTPTNCCSSTGTLSTKNEMK